MEMLIDFCGYCFECLFQTPGFVLVHLTGFLIWKYFNDVTVTLRSALPGLLVSELLLVADWYFDCLGIFGTVSVSAVCLAIFVCWTKLGKITIKDDATFIADNVKAKLPAFVALVKDSHEHKNKTYYNTDLQYAEYKPFFWGKAAKYAVNLDDIQSLEEGVQPDLVRSLQQPTERTFHLTVGDNTTITYIADTEERRDKWIEAFHTVVNRKIDKYKEKWLDWVIAQRTTKVDGTEIGRNDLGVTMTTVLEILKQANRPLDKAYAKDIFNTFAKISSSQPVNGEATLDRDRFHMFFDFAAKRPDIQQIYDRLLYKKKGEVSMSPKRLKTFLTEEQRESPSLETCEKWIKCYERIIPKHNLSALGFTSLLLSEEHSIFNREHKNIYHDMHRPLSHYYIACSHNTYLMKDQLKGASSVEAYINAFKRGCKCVELDCWDGANNEPIIYHGHTLTSKILFRDVVTAVRDHGFTVSKYPVILSFENHCSVEQQKVMANHLVNILGPKLYTKSIPDNETELPSPEDLSGYVLVKGKKLKAGQPEEDAALDEISSDEEFDEDELNKSLNTSGRRGSSPNPRGGSSPSLPAATNPTIPSSVLEEKDEDGNNNNGDVIKEYGISGDRKDSVNGTDAVSESKEVLEDGTAEPDSTEGKRKMSTLSRLKQKITKEGSDSTKSAKKKRPKVPKIAQELSDLVVYCQAVHFGGWQHAKDDQTHAEMSSFGEKKAVQFAKEQGRQFVEFTRRQLARIYPAGTRIDSSNYDPVALWNAGCQLVALNYQTAGRSMLLNQALFMNNGGCGYVLKPWFLTADNSTFDPKGPYDAKQCKFILIHMMSGHQLPYTNEKQLKAERRLYVQIKLSGVEQDEQKEKTKAVKNNGYNPIWNEVVGFKVHVPGLAFLSFIVYDADQVLAQYTLPFQSIMQGYRHVPLTNRNSEPLPTSSLFVKIEFKESS